jgi:hypothetical protein
MGGEEVEWAEQALINRVDQWVAAHPYHFLVSSARLVKPRRPGTITGMTALRPREANIIGREPASPHRRAPTGTFRLEAAKAARERARPLVLPLRKVQTTFPSMITVGRTENNDLVIPDEQVSKVHAFFRQYDHHLEISDAGSRNGTFVAGRRLESRGASVPVKAQDRVCFGALEFILLDARACWEWLRQVERF